MVRSGGDRYLHTYIYRLGQLWTRAAFCARHRERRGRTHHRVSLRSGPRHSNGHHGWHRTRRPRRSSHQERRGARNPRKSRHDRLRQDRHTHGREAEGGCNLSAKQSARYFKRRVPAAGSKSRTRQRASARCGHYRESRRAKVETKRAGEFSIAARPRHTRNRRREERSSGQHRFNETGRRVRTAESDWHSQARPSYRNFCRHQQPLRRIDCGRRS